ncbi:RCC1 domain-containing protein [Streptomyces smaragdinus]|nr:SpaA isopeptide-forming pilin-related protein [Streptomyces smaragdinus]
MRVVNLVRRGRTTKQRRRSPLLAATVCGLVAGLGLSALTAVPAAAQSTDSTLAFGYDNHGQLGDGGTTDQTTPVEVDLPAGVVLVDVDAGGHHSLGVSNDGRVFAWGANSDGQLGDGTTTDRHTPVEVDFPAGVEITQVEGGRAFSLALASDGRVFAWGDNFYGQLGDGTTTDRHTPVAVHLPAGVTATDLGAGRTHSLAVTTGGGVLAWGRNNNGQLGDGTLTSRTTPVTTHIPPGADVMHVDAGEFFSLAHTAAGGLLAWGDNPFGQLGDGTTTDRTTPVGVQLPAGVTVTDFAAGGYHALAVTDDGTVLAWGHNSFGQLGDGTLTERHLPVLAQLPAGVTVDAVRAGDYHSLARTTDGRLLAWGDGVHGGIDGGAAVTRRLPDYVDLPAGRKVADFSGGISFSLAVLAQPPAPSDDQGQVILHKTDAASGDPLAGAVFRLWRETNEQDGLQTGGETPDTAIGEGCATGPEGRCLFSGLVTGDYYLEETDVPEGYALPSDPVTGPIAVDGAGEAVTVSLGNDLAPCEKGDKAC